MASREHLLEQRYRALLREHPSIGMRWAEGQIAAHRLLAELAELGWSREDQLLCLQEMHRSTWAQVAQREGQANG